MAQVQDEATLSNCRAIHAYRNKKRNTYRPDETETQIKKSEERDYSPKPPICQKIQNPRNSGCATKPDINM